MDEAAYAQKLKVMEADACGPVVTQLLKGTANKKPKVPPECLKCLTAAYAAFGAKAMPNPDIIGKLKDLLQATVRSSPPPQHATHMSSFARDQEASQHAEAKVQTRSSSHGAQRGACAPEGEG